MRPALAWFTASQLVATAIAGFFLAAGASPAAAGDAYAATPAGEPDVHDEIWRALDRWGIQLDMQGHHDAADTIWDWLELRDPGDAEPWLRRIDTVYWRHWYDETAGLADEEILSLLERSKTLAERRLKDDPKNLRARWLLGEVLMQQARFEGQRGNYMKAGTMGERGRNELESLLRDQPDNFEARYTLGLYYYFASLMPDVVKRMSWLWFIPKGDRDKGLALLGEARAKSRLYRPPASMVLMSIYTYHAPTDIPAALHIARELHTTYPENAILHFELLEVLLKAGRYDELRTEALVLEQRLGESEGVTGRAMLARLWRARASVDVGDATAARPIVFGLEPDDPELPRWGVPWLWLVRAQVLDLEGDRASAVAAYERVVSLETEDFHSRRPVRMAQSGIEAAYVPGDAIDGPVMRSRD